MRFAWLFPGQGAQYVGMGRDFSEVFPIARKTYEEADELLGEFLSRTIFTGPEENLTRTDKSQVAIFVTSVALLRVLQSQFPDLHPSVCAGLSLGEYTALFASERLSFKEALHLVAARGRFMSEACDQTEGTMAAVLGLSEEKILSLLEGVDGVWVANYNCPGQIVISGTKKGIAMATEKLKGGGAKRVLLLAVHGAFHSGLMESARLQLKPLLDRANFQESSIPLVMNVPGNFISDESVIPGFLADQVTHSVRWEQGVRAIEKRGVDGYLEIGCGKTLSGMNRKMELKEPTYSLEKVTDLDALAQGVFV